METTCQGRYSTYEIRVRAVEAVSRGLPVGEVAAAYQIDRSTLFRWVTRHRVNGTEGLRRKVGSGRPRLLDDLDKAALWNIVLRSATSFGFETDLWTIGRVHQVVQEE
jgi:transposase